jgi:hypothetical protein
MVKLAMLFAAGVLGAALVTAPSAKAQVSVGINVGPEPVCPYGYYDVPPYDCAPYGYYGPDWFVNGAFIGAGPWFHGPAGFYGHVDTHFDRDHYHGRFPARGERASRPLGQNFHGNQMRDGRGHQR